MLGRDQVHDGDGGRGLRALRVSRARGRSSPGPSLARARSGGEDVLGAGDRLWTACARLPSLTIRGAANTSVIQDVGQWLFTGPFQDITFLVDVAEMTNSPTMMSIETAPSKDPAMFLTAVSPQVATSFGVGLNTGNVLLVANPGVPIGAWTRWKLNAPAATWDVTFRILATGNTLC